MFAELKSVCPHHTFLVLPFHLFHCQIVIEWGFLMLGHIWLHTPTFRFKINSTEFLSLKKHIIYKKHSIWWSYILTQGICNGNDNVNAAVDVRSLCFGGYKNRNRWHLITRIYSSVLPFMTVFKDSFRM